MNVYETKNYGSESNFKSTTMLTDLTKLDVNVLEVALTHLIEELTDTNEDLKEIGLQEQLDSLDDPMNIAMDEDLKNQRRLRIQQDMFRTNLQLSQLRKSLGLGGGVQQAGNSFDVTGGTQTQSGLDLGTAVSA